MAKQTDPTERAQQLLQELRTATAEAAGVRKDLERLNRELRTHLAEAEGLAEAMGNAAQNLRAHFERERNEIFEEHFMEWMLEKVSNDLPQWWQAWTEAADKHLAGQLEQLTPELMADLLADNPVSRELAAVAHALVMVQENMAQNPARSMQELTCTITVFRKDTGLKREHLLLAANGQRTDQEPLHPIEVPPAFVAALRTPADDQ